MIEFCNNEHSRWCAYSAKFFNQLRETKRTMIQCARVMTPYALKMLQLLRPSDKSVAKMQSDFNKVKFKLKKYKGENAILKMQNEAMHA